MSYLKCFGCLLTVLIHGSMVLGEADLEALSKRSDAFHQAWLSGDKATLEEILAPQAVYLTNDGRDAHTVPAILRKRVELSADGEQDSLAVVYRQMHPFDGVVVIKEIVGAAPGIAEGRRITPTRRTLVWQYGEHGWRIIHLHASPYSRWESAISAYEAADRERSPQSGGIVFVGSSSIRGWKETLAEDFPGLNAIGRGFGGSQLVDSILYAHRIVTPYQPTAVAVYAGDNDMAQGKSAEQVFADFRTLVSTIQASDPAVRVGFIAIKPSLSRWGLWPKMKAANQRIEQWSRGQPLVEYLDIASPMLGNDGRPMESLFLKDGLHLNREGYRVWTNVVFEWAQR